MELLVDNHLINAARLADRMREANEMLAIIVSSAKTARSAVDA